MIPIPSNNIFGANILVRMQETIYIPCTNPPWRLCCTESVKALQVWWLQTASVYRVELWELIGVESSLKWDTNGGNIQVDW